MSANIAVVNGQAAMAYQGQTPWHKLGTRLPSIQSVQEALEAAHLSNWNLQLETLHRPDGTVIPDRQSVIRTLDNVYISNVGPGYEILSNEDGFGVLSDVIAKHNVTIETAGALGRGEKVWILARLPESIEPIPGDKVNGYILIIVGHDGLQSHTGKLTPVRVVCQNTLDAAVSGDTASLFRFRHTASIKDKQKDAEALITRMVDALKATGETFAQLANRRMNAKEVADYIEAVFPAADDKKESKALLERRQTVAQLVWNGNGATLAGSNADGTNAWAAYNAVTEYFDHVRPAEAQRESAKQSANVSALFGHNASVKALALVQARQLLAAA